MIAVFRALSRFLSVFGWLVYLALGYAMGSAPAWGWAFALVALVAFEYSLLLLVDVEYYDKESQSQVF